MSGGGRGSKRGEVRFYQPHDKSLLAVHYGLSDRILVCRQGRMVEEFSPLDATEERVMYAAVH